MFRIKICGVKNLSDAQAVVAAGADAIGLNFYSRSSRFVQHEIAHQLAVGIPSSVAKVGVFVNATNETIRDCVAQVPLDYVQLHGDELPTRLVELANLKLIKAFRVGPEGIQPVLDYLSECEKRGRLPDAILLDALSREAYGGTGQSIDWNIVHEVQTVWPSLPIILAGGLNPSNVAEAIQAAQPVAVDTASGVESSPGIKDHAKIVAFVTAAQYSFALLPGHEPEN